ncbi:MAG: YfiR family protein [Sulfuricurvum sp.]|jgi:hypothetical protein|uniref:YfiR family protein n=1 Tax=Sulfuricurvum sp. TaxID=2025608 RepID=UPI0025E6B8D1|nr:YfiR family protein [Sulfuricurvum sp.]MCK9371973.1 YfiR family protein [Sulfuricurvum sp.]
MKASVFLLLFVHSCIAPLFAVSEESIKAAYLERFAMFIEWPKPIKSYNICIFNDPVFSKTLQKSYDSNLFNNRPATVIPLFTGSSAEEMSECHILFFRTAKPAQNEAQLNLLRKNNVLLISDEASDVKKGAAIGFYLENNAFRFLLSQRNLETANLKASYKLLNFATLIDPTEGKNAAK